MSGAGACKRAFPDDEEAAFALFDAWSACSIKEYDGSEATRKKFDEVPIEYDGEAIPVMLGMLHWRAKRRAEKVIRLFYSPLAGQKIAQAFQNHPTFILGADIGGFDGPYPKGDEPIPPGTLTPEDGRTALEYLLFCWSEKVYKQAIEGQQIPQHVLDNVRQRAEERRERIDLNGRVLHIWHGSDLAADTTALANRIINAGVPFLTVDQILVRVSDPTSNSAHAERLRKSHNYTGPPGGKGDPVQGGMRLVTILPSDTEATRTIIAERIATKIQMKVGTGKTAVVKYVIGSFEFKSQTRIRQGPDANVLKDLSKRMLPEHAPKVQGIATAPVMDDLPESTKLEELT